MPAVRELHNVVLRVERRGPALQQRNRTAILVACVLALLAVVGLMPRSSPTPLAASLDDSYEDAVFPAYHDNRLASMKQLRELSEASEDSPVFPKYSAYQHGDDDTGVGSSDLMQAQRNANRWMRMDSRDWTGHAANPDLFIMRAHRAASRAAQQQAGEWKRNQESEYLIEDEPQNEQLASAKLPNAGISAGVLQSLDPGGNPYVPGGNPWNNPQQGNPYNENCPCRGGCPCPAHGHGDNIIRATSSRQKLYIPAMYNDKVDPQKEMEEMMRQFAAIILEIQTLESQMQCAAACTNSTVNSSGLNFATSTFEVSFDDSHKNVTGDILHPADDLVAHACLTSCGISDEMLNATFSVEASTGSKFAAILKAVSARKQELQIAQERLQATQNQQIARLQESSEPIHEPSMRKSPAQSSSTSAPPEVDRLAKFSDAWFGHTASHSQIIQREIGMAKRPVGLVRTVDAAVEPREDQKANGTQGKHSFAYHAALAKSDQEARAWKPPPPPHFDAAKNKNPASSSAVAKALGAPMLYSVPAALLYSVPAARQQSLLLEDARRVKERQGVRSQLSQRKARPATAELIDWTVDLSKLARAGSATSSSHLLPPRDSIRHTTGRPGQISEAQQILPEGAQHMRNVKPANPAQFDGFL